jgi:hypothetical protein
MNTRNILMDCLVVLALCSMATASVARADDCSDSLIAESCACQSSTAKSSKQTRRTAKQTASAKARSAKPVAYTSTRGTR